MVLHRCSALALGLLAAAVVTFRHAAAASIEDQPPPNGCEPVTVSSEAAPAVAPTSDFPPLQLEIFTPFEPTAFPSAGRNYVIYELHLKSFDRMPFALGRVDVVAGGRTLATFDSARLTALLQPRGGPPGVEPTGLQLDANEGAVAFLCLAFDGDAPERLTHRVHTDRGVAEGTEIRTRHTELRSFGSPVTGTNWSASSAPSNDSHHRTGLVVFDGRAQIARRYAIDWLQLEDGAMFSGDENDNSSYFAYGEEVLAVADGTVVTVIDGLQDNRRTAAGFQTAVPITSDTLGGNFIALDLGGGQFASYSHLQAGSLRVKEGDRVRRGQALARIGMSGDARAPHLHIQITTTPSVFAAEGVPYVIDEYRVKSPDGAWEQRTNELPLSDMLVDFGDVARRGN
jgi:hypothetical protein